MLKASSGWESGGEYRFNPITLVAARISFTLSPHHGSSQPPHGPINLNPFPGRAPPGSQDRTGAPRVTLSSRPSDASVAEALAGREDMRVHSVRARIQTHLVTKVNNVPTLPQIIAIPARHRAADVVPDCLRSGFGGRNDRRKGGSGTRFKGGDFHDSARPSKHASSSSASRSCDRGGTPTKTHRMPPIITKPTRTRILTCRTS